MAPAPFPSTAGSPETSISPSVSKLLLYLLGRTVMQPACPLAIALSPMMCLSSSFIPSKDPPPRCLGVSKLHTRFRVNGRLQHKAENNFKVSVYMTAHRNGKLFSTILGNFSLATSSRPLPPAVFPLGIPSQFFSSILPPHLSYLCLILFF